MERECGRLLIVDDDPLNLQTLDELIRPHGHELKTASGGEDALLLVEEMPFDVVLLDVSMPGMDGFEVLKRVRAMHPPTKLPVVMITGLGQRENVLRALSLGANDYIVKPFDLSIVLARIATQLSLKRAVDKIIDLERAVDRKNKALEQANRELELAYQHIKSDLESAARVQRALLPTSLPQSDGVSFAWAYRPCDELAGDSLNVFPLGEDHVGFYLLDVSGHGVRAALLSVAVSRLLAPLPDGPSLVQRRNSHTGELEPTPPSEVAEELNRRFQLRFDTYQYFTIFYGVLNVRTRELRYVCAGQTGPVHVPAGGDAVSLNHLGIAIGLVPNPDYRDGTLQLRPGDRLYLYSDGLDEARNEANELFGNQRIVHAVADARTVGLEESLQALVRTAEDWAGHPFDDDISAIALETCRA